MNRTSPARALALVIDASIVIAIVEATRLLYNAQQLRTVALWSTLLFASAGVVIATFVAVFPVILILCALPSPPRRASAALSIATIAVAVGALSTGRTLVFVIATLIARWLLAPGEGAGFSRAVGALFAALFACASLASSHVVRAHLMTDSLVVRAPLRALAARLPAPALTASSTSERSAAESTAVEHALTIAVELRGIAPELAMSMGSTQLIARNGALFIDARRSTDGTTALSRWQSRFDSRSSSTRYVRCDDARSVESCALSALSSPRPLALALRFSTTNPALIDRQLAAVLRAAHARTPLSNAIVALTSESLPSDSWLDDRDTRALVILSGRGIARGLVRGAVRVDEVARALDALATGGDDPVVALAQRRSPWFDRTVVLSTTRATTAVRSVHSARYSLVLAPTQWGVALFDHELDPRERVNRADILRSIVHAMAPRAGAHF